MVESLQRSPQTAIRPPCLLLDLGLERGGGAMPSIRLSVSVHERRREQKAGQEALVLSPFLAEAGELSSLLF